jgi:hypothetical protein
VLCAVEPQRPAAEEQREHARRSREAGQEAVGRGEEGGEDAGGEREQDEAALAALGHAAPREQRADRGGEPHEPADERHARDAATGQRLPPDAHAAVTPREGPEALAGDHDPVRAGHSAETRPHAGSIGTGEDLDDGGVRPHPSRVPDR